MRLTSLRNETARLRGSRPQLSRVLARDCVVCVPCVGERPIWGGNLVFPGSLVRSLPIDLLQVHTGGSATMSQPEDKLQSTLDPGGRHRAAVTEHPPMRPAPMQGKLPQEVDVTAHPQSPKHHADADDHPMDRRRLDTTRLDRQAALDLLAGEVSHELAPTLTFLRCLSEGPGSSALSSEDGQLARRQIERLQRMQRHLRQLTLPPPEREPVPGLDVLRRAAVEVADLLSTKRLTLTWAVPAPLMLRSDAPLLYILARDLLAAVARDADTEGTVVVQATLPSGREGGTIEVGRSARGAAQPLARDPFDPWAAMLSENADLGLAVCYRVARTLGWELVATAETGRAGLRLLIPTASYCAEPAR